jgi:hypothetical protein
MHNVYTVGHINKIISRDCRIKMPMYRFVIFVSIVSFGSS